MSRTSTFDVLVVDDDRDLLIAFRDFLEAKGYSVDLAGTGKEAVEKSRRNSYQLVVVDIRLPDIDGIEVLRRMSENSQAMKKIVVTGYPTLENAIDALRHGVNGYLLKPIDPSEFVKAVDEQLRGKRVEERSSLERQQAGGPKNSSKRSDCNTQVWER